jgi:shikimate kinase
MVIIQFSFNRNRRKIYAIITLPYPNRIYIVGMPGSGKSTLGKRLAHYLQYQFYDLDSAIEQNVGMSIPNIFAIHPESFFRAQEQQALHATANLCNVIIATGGGCAAYQNNMQWMNKHGFTMYLRANISLLTHRILASKQVRPMFNGLKSDELTLKLDLLLKARCPYYDQSKYIADVPVKSVETLVKSMF